MRKKKYYIASKTVHAPKWRALREQGILVTSSWIDEAEENQTDSYEELAIRCFEDIKQSDAVLLYCERGEILKGALIEAGMALAIDIPVLCIGEGPSISRVFREHPLWLDFQSVDDALRLDPLFFPGGDQSP